MASLQRAIGTGRRAILRLAHLVVQSLGPALLLLAMLVGLLQPDTGKADPLVILAIGSLLGLSLSVGAAVTLLIAQQIAERYPRQLFREFRRDPTWIFVVGVAAAAVCLSAGAALWRPTVSTAWAAWLALSGVLLLAASRLPSLLDSLDAEVLVTRVASHATVRLKAHESRDDAAKEVQDGVESLTTVARQGVQLGDPKVVAAALAGVNELVAAYVVSRAYGGIEDPTVDFAMQRYELVAEAAVGASRVVALPAVIDSARDLGTKAAGFRLLLNPDWEAVTARITNLLTQIAAASLTDRLSWSGSMATVAISKNAVELVREGRARSISRTSPAFERLGSPAYPPMRST